MQRNSLARRIVAMVKRSAVAASAAVRVAGRAIGRASATAELAVADGAAAVAGRHADALVEVVGRQGVGGGEGCSGSQEGEYVLEGDHDDDLCVAAVVCCSDCLCDFVCFRVVV